MAPRPSTEGAIMLKMLSQSVELTFRSWFRLSMNETITTKFDRTVPLYWLEVRA